MEGNCMAWSIVYQATVSGNKGKESYIGITGDKFKTRYRNYIASLKDKRKMDSTELSKHIWSLKDAGAEYTLS